MINENTIYKKLVLNDGMIISGYIKLVETLGHLMATDGERVFPMSSVRFLVKQDKDEACSDWQPSLYQSGQDDDGY